MKNVIASVRMTLDIPESVVQRFRDRHGDCSDEQLLDAFAVEVEENLPEYLDYERSTDVETDG